jgi:dynein assembly factor 5
MESNPDIKDKKVQEELSSEGEGESEYSDSDTECSVNGIPVKNSEKLLRYIQRDLNMLSDESKVKRKFALLNLYNLFVKQETKIETHIMQEILPSIQKPLLKRFMDPVEKCRELSILIIKEFFKR